MGWLRLITDAVLSVVYRVSRSRVLRVQVPIPGLDVFPSTAADPAALPFWWIGVKWAGLSRFETLEARVRDVIEDVGVQEDFQ